MKLKKFVLAAVALATAPAFAAIQLPSSGDGELFLTVYNDTVKSSFTLDLGVLGSAWRSAADGAEAGFSRSWAVSATPEFANFVSAAGAPAGWRWEVLGADATGSGVPDARSVLSTVTLGQGIAATTGQSVGATSNNSLQSSQLSFDNYLNQINDKQGNAPFSDFSVNGGFTNDGPGTYALNAALGFVGNRGNGNWNWTADNAVGDSASFVYVTRSGTSNLASAKVRVDLFDNSASTGAFTFSPDAQGAFVLTYELTAAVPEPGTYGLLLAGLAAVGFVARRRQAR